MSFRQVFTDRGSHVYIFQIKLQNGHKNSAFSMNQFGQNLHFFHFPLFSRLFWIDLKRRPLGIRKK